MRAEMHDMVDKATAWDACIKARDDERKRCAERLAAWADQAQEDGDVEAAAALKSASEQIAAS